MSGQNETGGVVNPLFVPFVPAEVLPRSTRPFPASSSHPAEVLPRSTRPFLASSSHPAEVLPHSTRPFLASSSHPMMSSDDNVATSISVSIVSVSVVVVVALLVVLCIVLNKRKLHVHCCLEKKGETVGIGEYSRCLSNIGFFFFLPVV